MSAFVTALNVGTVTAPVTMYAIGGSSTETATAGGISITQTGTVANPIVFQKFGTGSYTIQASAALTSGILHDAIFELVGADYITIDGFTLLENAANSNSTAGTNNMTEWGIALLKTGATDGSQNNTIQNNIISLNKTYRNTFAIYSNTRHTSTAVTTTVDATAVSGTNSNNKVYANSISNVMMGVTFIGTSASAFHDSGNDIGGTSAATGNTLTNWGGNSAASGYVSNSGISYCIYLNHQVNDNVSYNNLNSGSQGSGVSIAFEAIRKDYTGTAPTGTITTNISYNTITMTSAFTGGNFTGIRSQGMTLSTGTINITNNNFLNTAVTAAGSTSSFGGIINSSSCGTLNITNNIIRGHTSVSSGGYTGITNSGAVVNTINITDNKIGDAIAGALTQTTATVSQLNAITNTGGASTATINLSNNSFDGFSVVTYGQTIFTLNNAASAVAINMNNNQLGTATGSLITFSGAQSSVVYGLFNNAGTSTATLSIQNNDIRGIVHSVAGSNAEQYFNSNVAVLSQTMSNNTFTNISTNTTGQVILMFRAGALASGATWTCSNNSIVTGFSKTGAGSTLYGYYSPNASVNGSTMTETGNNFSNVSVTGATTITLWSNEEGQSVTNGPTKIITGNTFNNITGGSSPVNVFRLGYGAATNCSNNTMTNITGTGAITGIFNDFNDGQGTVNYSNNTMSNFISSGTGGNVTGITGSFPFVPTTNINGNTITGFSSTADNAGIVGINQINSGTTANIYDNLITNFSGSGLIAPTIYGIIVSGGVGVNVFRNRIHTLELTGPISAGSSGIHGMFLNGGNVTVHNNFIANLNAPAASLNNAIMGIGIFSATASTTFNLYYNAVYLNATSIGTNFFTSGVYHITNATATTGALNMTNNIIVNTSTATGTGVTAAYRRSDATLTNFASSDHNLLFAGTPSASNVIFYDGTNSDLTLAAYQTRVSPKDANSISLMPTFVSNTDLHLTTANCGIDGRGTPIAITTDIDNVTRDVTTPDIGADEFAASYGPALAGITGSAVCDNKIVSAAGTNYATSVCDLIARVVPSGADPVAGKVNVCVTLDATQQYFNGEPYVQRHFDLEPTTSNQTTTSATITLYFTNAEFVLYNTNNGAWPQLPTAVLGNADPNRANVKVTQFHGAATTSPSSPGNYTGVRVLIAPGAANVFWNGTYWAVTFNVAGFSGFYVHTNNFNAPLPIVVNYLTGRKQGSNHLLNWKITCASTPRATMTLERSSDARNYSGIYTITADAARCQQPFDYTDANPLKGMNYYRLKIVDADGHVTYSTTVALLNAVKGFDIVSIAPNPVVADNFKLNIASAQSGKMEFIIFDMHGRLVNRQTLSLIAGFNSMAVNVANLSPGTYTIKGNMGDDQSKVIRFVKQ